MDWQCDSTTCSYEVSPGFAHSDRPFREVVAPADYTFVYASPWRIAVPADAGAWPAVAALLARMRAEGPPAAGYVAVGSTLVPSALTPGGRMALATATAKYVRI